MIQTAKRNFLIGTFIFFVSVPSCFAQVAETSPRPERGPHQYFHKFHFIPDLTLNSLEHYEINTDTTLQKTSEKKFRMKRSPWLAVGLSAILPGAGQFYNKSYWKVPVILGLSAYLGYVFYDNDKKYRDYRDQYSASQTPENPEGELNLKTLREFYFDQRNDFVWYFMIVYFLNLVDAYVDAHLFDFDVKEEKLTRFGLSDREYKLKMKINF